jgi:hypothetical protein
MVAGASLATLAMWTLHVEAERHLERTGASDRRGRGTRWTVEAAMGAAFLVGLATLQAEFDFGVPQFRLLYQPILLAVAAGIGLVTARLRLGRGGALAAAAGFILIRGTLTLLVGPVLDRIEPHFPLLIVEALLVEAVAAAVPRDRPLRLGAIAGFAIGTIGFAAEWAWSHLWMPAPWQPSMLDEAIPLTAAAGVAAGVLGALVGRALAGGETTERAVPLRAAALAGAVAVAAIAWPLPVDDGGGVTAAVELADVAPAPTRAVEATVTIDPASAAEDADWLTVTAWQGAGWEDRQAVIDHLEEVDTGVWRTTRPIPVHGDWKAMIRLHNGRTLAAAPIFMPGDSAIPAEEVPAPASFQRQFVTDKELLQREFTGGPPWLELSAYAVLLAIAVGWVWLVAWGLARLIEPGRARPLEPEELRARAASAEPAAATEAGSVDQLGHPVR